jgi:hypothetical protein
VALLDLPLFLEFEISQKDWKREQAREAKWSPSGQRLGSPPRETKAISKELLLHSF